MMTGVLIGSDWQDARHAASQRRATEIEHSAPGFTLVLEGEEPRVAPEKKQAESFFYMALGKRACSYVGSISGLGRYVPEASPAVNVLEQASLLAHSYG